MVRRRTTLAGLAVAVVLVVVGLLRIPGFPVGCLEMSYADRVVMQVPPDARRVDSVEAVCIDTRCYAGPFDGTAPGGHWYLTVAGSTLVLALDPASLADAPATVTVRRRDGSVLTGLAARPARVHPNRRGCGPTVSVLTATLV